MSGCEIGTVGSRLKAVSSFIANLNLFTETNKIYKGTPKGVLGICMVKDASHITQNKFITL
jgi:hypothetical protein